MISSLRQEQERITSLDATAWQPYQGTQIPLIPGHETAEQTGKIGSLCGRQHLADR